MTFNIDKILLQKTEQLSEAIEAIDTFNEFIDEPKLKLKLKSLKDDLESIIPSLVHYINPDNL